MSLEGEAMSIKHIIDASAFKRVRIFALVASVWFLWPSATPVCAQTYLQNVGVPPFAADFPVEGGNINAANGNLHFEIPLGSFPQRGGRTDKAALVYDSTIWLPDVSFRWLPTNIIPDFWSVAYSGGWRLVTSGETGYATYGELDSGYCPATDTYAVFSYTPWIYIGPDGTQHSFPVRTTGALFLECPRTEIPNASGYASDGSGYFISITDYTTATVYAPDGTVAGGFGYAGAVKTDPNGNLYSMPFSSPPWDWQIHDTLNRKLVEVTESADRNTMYFAVLNAQGSTSTYTVKLGTVNVSTAFGYGGFLEYSGTLEVPTEIDLPDGTKYQFAYDSGTTSGHYGLLTNMVTPDAGQVGYSYANFSDAYGNKSRWITHRSTTDSSSGWSYGGPSVVTSCTSAQVNCQQTVTVTKPSGDNIVYTFTLNGGSWLTQEQTYNGSISSANLLSTTAACYTFVTVTNGQCSYSVTTSSSATNVYKASQTTTLPIPGSSVSATTGYTWDPGNIGNLTQVKEWNFGNSPANAPDRTLTS
jgi:hypothetical protein